MKASLTIRKTSDPDEYLLEASGDKVSVPAALARSARTPGGWGLTITGRRYIVPHDPLWWIMGQHGEDMEITIGQAYDLVQA